MLLLASLALAAVMSAAAQVLTATDGGERDLTPSAVVPVASFGPGFAQLHQQIGDTMGRPVEDEHQAEDAEAVQRTTTGLAVWRRGEQPTFTDGWRVWRLEVQGTLVQASAPAAAPVARGVWDRLAECEASGNWSNASNPKYKGGLQMDATFWRTYGGLAFAPAPHLATREQQIVVAERGLKVQGFKAWPVCSIRLGLR